MFSFNSPFGACPTCTGLGTQLKVDPALIIPDGACPSWTARITASGWNSADPTASAGCITALAENRFHFGHAHRRPAGGVQRLLYGTGEEKITVPHETSRPVAAYCTAL